MLVESNVPPVAAVNHATVAPAGGVAVNVAVPAPQRLIPFTVGAAGGVLIIVTGTNVRVAEMQLDVRDSTKNAVSLLRIPVVNDKLDDNGTPPLCTLYQATVCPEGTLALSTTVPEPQ